MSTRPDSRAGAPAVVVSSPLSRLIQLLGLGDANVLRRLADELHRTTVLLSGRDDGRGGGSQDALASLEQAVADQAEAAERVAELAGRVERRLVDPPVRAPGTEQTLAAVELALDRLMSESVDDASARAEDVTETADVPTPGHAAADDEPSPTAAALMHLVDRVGAAASGRENPDPLISWLNRQLVAVLAGEGVTLIDDDGRFDPTRHEVVDTRTAERADQSDCISATVRPGFVSGRRVLRPQQVVLWQWEE
jgi:hypothetical protein